MKALIRPPLLPSLICCSRNSSSNRHNRQNPSLNLTFFITHASSSNPNTSSPRKKDDFPSLSSTTSSSTPIVVVVGSANADIYLEIERLPREGETIAALTGQTLAGGKGANQACCAARLSLQDSPTYFLGQIGTDAHGRLIEDSLRGGCSVRLDCLTRVPDAPTGHAVVMLQPDGHNSIIIVGGANMSCWPHTLPLPHLDLLGSAGIVLLQREIPDRINILAAQAAKKSGVPVILDAGGVDAPIPNQLLNCVDILSPNETELARLTTMPTESFEEICRAAIKCHEMVMFTR